MEEHALFCWREAITVPEERGARECKVGRFIFFVFEVMKGRKARCATFESREGDVTVVRVDGVGILVSDGCC